MIAEREMHGSDDKRRLLEAMPAGLVHARGDTVLYCNETFAEMVGEPADALVGRLLFDVIAPEHAERARLRRDDRQRGLRAPARWECDLIRKDGKRIRVELEPRALADGEHLILLRDLGSALRDIELSNSLSALALRLQRERSVEAVLRTAAVGLAELGMFMDALRVEGDFVVVHTVSPSPVFAHAFEAAVGRPLEGMRLPLDQLAQLRQIVDGGLPIYLDDTAPMLTDLVGAEQARALADVAGSKAVLAPLYVGDRAWGVLVVGSDALGNRDAATLSLFSAQVAGAMEVARTIDELDRANRGLQAIQVDNERLHEETRRRLDLLSVQYGLSRAIAGSLEEEPLAAHALGLLIEKLGADAGWIYVQRDGQLRLIGSRTMDGGDARNNIDAVLGIDAGSVCGMCASQREPIVADLAANPEIRSPAARALGMRHISAVPLVLDDRLVGTLSVARTDAGGFRDEELQLIESSAVQLAVALERSRLFVAERRRVHDLSRLNELGAIISQHLELPALLSLGVEYVMRLVDVPQVFLSLLDPTGRALRVVASNLREPGILDISMERDGISAAAASVRELRPVLIDDPMSDPRAARAQARRFGQKAALAVPLISRGEAIGALVLGETRADRCFGPEAIGGAVAVANQLAGAIANARLFEEERDRVRELSLLSELGRIASGTLQREVLLSESLGHISGSLRFESGAAWVVQRGGRLERAATRAPAADGPSAADMEGLARRAIAAAAPICEAAPGDVYACALPLLAGTEAGGVLAFARRGKPVLDAELRTLAAAAPELGVALQNARLFDDARLRVEQLRLLLDIGRAITGSLDLDSILETSAGILNRFIDGSNAFILLLGPNDQLRGAACSNPAWRESFRSTRIALDDPRSIAAASVRERRAVAISDVNRSAYAGSTRVALYDEQSVLALPLLVRDEPIGCVLVDDTRSPRAWSPEEIERATLIVHQVAVAVANARLYDDLKRSYGELARTQEELVKRERLAALGELSAVVAHEVRNPLGVIFNSLGSMRRLLKPTGDGAMLLDIVEEEADRLDRIVRDLLDFARPNEPALETERLDDLLADTLQAVDGDARPPGVHVDVQLPDDLPRLRIDARMIRQVLLNLVLNGMQAMPRGGTLRIRAAHEPKSGRLVRIEFQDEGTGVQAELAARIFQPFFTTKAAGTGLGLAVVKRFVDAHRGRIDFQSRPGEGTTFTVYLPIDEAV